MKLTVTAKIKIFPTAAQAKLLLDTTRAYSDACNFVSGYVFASRELNQFKLQNKMYYTIRERFSLPAQMAVNVVRNVISSYRTIKTQGNWTKVEYKHGAYSLTWNRDYSLKSGLFSLNTLIGREKFAYEQKGMGKYFNGSWVFGIAKVVNKHGKWYLHIPMSKDFDMCAENEVANVVGVDFGVNYTAVSYNSCGRTVFFDAHYIKHRRARYKKLRQNLQRRQTASARRRLKAIGSRENRWMQDVNHRVSKALVESSPQNTLFAIENLSGIRAATEKVRIKDRYVSVSWAFFDLRQKLEYKARMNKDMVMALDPQYTSQTCPKCGHTEKANRDKKNHVFKCKNCGYASNDDRIGAMNLHRKGIEYLSAVAGK